MPADHILVLAVDGLRASALGAYGNTSFPTPTLDRLAAESFLFDGCFAGAPELPLIYRALWQALHPLRAAANDERSSSLPAMLSGRGYATTLVTDEPEVVSLTAASRFDRCVEVTGSAAARADDVSQTSMARLFAAACEAIEDSVAGNAERPQLLWVHARGMYGPWDAPLELQDSLLDEDDPPPRDSVDPPDILLTDADDPDTAFVCGCACAAQAMVLDACVDALLAAVDDAWPDGRWLLVLVGTRGFPLGEHKQVGGIDDRLHVEQLLVPMLWRMPDGTGRLARSGQLATHADLLPTLLAWVDGAAPVESADGMSLLPLLTDPGAPWRDAVLSAGAGGSRAIRTADWCLINHSDGNRSAEHSAAGPELYVRPDDRWEANDVAQLCSEEVELLSGLMDDRAKRIEEGRPMESRWLPERESPAAV